MILPFLTNSELLALLSENGWSVVENEYFDKFDRIILTNDNGESFPLQYEKKHFFLKVVRLCESLGIEAPETHVKCFEQYEKMRPNRKNQKR